MDKLAHVAARHRLRLLVGIANGQERQRSVAFGGVDDFGELSGTKAPTQQEPRPSEAAARCAMVAAMLASCKAQCSGPSYWQREASVQMTSAIGAWATQPWSNVAAATCCMRSGPRTTYTW